MLGRDDEARRINVEYVSANPTGPMHVGHGRGAVFGDALASVLAHAQLYPRAFVVSSFGKTYHVTGWKVGIRWCLPLPMRSARPMSLSASRSSGQLLASW